MTQDYNADALLPCPKCGDDAPYDDTCGRKREWHSVNCGRCSYSTATFETPEQAGIAWNTRIEEGKRLAAPSDDVLVKVARAIHEAHRNAPYPWWHVEADKCRVAPHLARAALSASPPSDDRGQIVAWLRSGFPGWLELPIAARLADAIEQGQDLSALKGE